MTSARAPLFTLLTLLVAAAAVVGGGAALARKEVVEKKPVGREELGDFTTALSVELGRLDAAYETKLRQLAETVADGSEIGLRAAARSVPGIRLLSIVRENGKDTHATFPDYPGVAAPARGENAAEFVSTRPTYEFAPGGASGWQGDVFYSFRRDLDAYVVLDTDPEVVSERVSEWVAERYALEFEPVAATGATIQIESPSARVLAADTSRAPDIVVPIKTRSGRWRVSAWDEEVRHTTYHTPTLIASAALGLVLALGGAGAFFLLRRWIAETQQRASFVNRVSHELRTPLTNILLNTDLAEQALATAPGEAALRLSLVREESSRLSRLVGNVLTFSRRESAPAPASEPVELAALVDSVAEPFLPALARKQIVSETCVSPDTRALADPDACAQILGNLLSNVEKYAPAGSSVHVRGGVSPEGCWIEVEDDGPGIAEADAPRIFDAFQRARNDVTDGVTGTGLGLTISRDLARAMGGELTYRPANPGARFRLTLPAAPGEILEMPTRAAS